MSVVTKNPYDLLGNDDGDSETPSAPVKTVDKTSTRTAKRSADEASSKAAPAPTGNRRGGSFTGNEAAFRDRGAGHDRNRGKPTEEAPRGGTRGGHNARVRGGRGGRFPRDRDDRHSKGLPSGSEKQAEKAWGGAEGEAELKDEQAGDEIAKTEQKDSTAEGETAVAQGESKEETPAEPAEPEEKHMTLADYLAQQAEKKLALEAEAPMAVRKPNEGIKENKKWANAKPLVKEDDEDYFAGTGGKAKRERERKTKQLVEIDNRYIEPERTRGGRGGRGGARGESTRGSGRGSGRGGRGDLRGGRGGGGRGEGQPINTSDTSAFPSLGS